MTVMVDIRFHNMDSSDAIEARVRERVKKLSRFFDRLVACRVAVEAPHKQHRKGNIHTVHIEMSVPGKDLVVSHAPHHPKERYKEPDLYTLLNEAFDIAERQLKAYKEKLRGEA